jgi:hypothetical protein
MLLITYVFMRSNQAKTKRPTFIAMNRAKDSFSTLFYVIVVTQGSHQHDLEEKQNRK